MSKSLILALLLCAAVFCQTGNNCGTFFAGDLLQSGTYLLTQVRMPSWGAPWRTHPTMSTRAQLTSRSPTPVWRSPSPLPQSGIITLCPPMDIITSSMPAARAPPAIILFISFWWTMIYLGHLSSSLISSVLDPIWLLEICNSLLSHGDQQLPMSTLLPSQLLRLYLKLPIKLPFSFLASPRLTANSAWLLIKRFSIIKPKV